MTLPVAILGAGGRGRLYAELLKTAFADRVELVGVVSRSPDRARDLAGAFDVPWALSDDLEGRLDAWGAAGAVVCPSGDANRSMALRVGASGRPLLLETPPALIAADGDALIDAAGDVAIEVAEQNPRGPWAAFATAVVRAGLLGRVRLASCDLASYRYHATGVARAVLGRPEGRGAVGLRAVFPDLPEHAQRVSTGAIELEGGAVFTVRDGEGLYLPGGPWRSGGWTLLGSTGSLTEHALRTEGTDHPLHYDVAEVDGVRFTRALTAGDVTWEAEYADLPLDDDRRAIARCVDDWLARADGRTTATQWSVADALADLRWIEAVERSATLGGARIRLRD